MREWKVSGGLKPIINLTFCIYLVKEIFTFIGEKLGKVMFVTAMLSVSRRLF